MGLPRGALKLLVAAGSAGVLYAVSVVIKRRRVVRAVRRQPKVEFHAHLHGSIRLATLVELAGGAAEAVLAGPRTLEACFEIFGLIHGCVTSLDTVRRVCREALEDFAAEGCCYAELRSTPRPLGGATEMDYILAVVDEMAAWEARPGSRLTPRYLVSVDRSRGPAAAKGTVDALVRLRAADERVRRMVVGVDFSGNPTSAQGFGAFEAVFRSCRDAHDLGCALHVGEVPRGDDDARRILSFARERPARCRLGHALFFDAGDLDGSASLVEVCPSSNAATLKLDSLRDHPRLNDRFVARRRNPPPITLCTDDTAVFDTDMTKEYLAVLDAFALAPDDLARLVDAAADFAFDAPACRAALRHAYADKRGS